MVVKHLFLTLTLALALAHPATATPVFTVVTDEAGLGSHIALRAIETGGAIWFDYDGDGWVDIFLTNGAEQPKSLFRNTGTGLFVQTTDEAGLGAATLAHNGFGVCAGDWDSDGDSDLVLAGQPTMVFANNGDNSFSEATALLPKTKGLVTQTAFCAFFDGDRDSDLDLVIGQDYGPIWYLENSGGTFGDAVIWPIEGAHTLALLPIDFDNDNDQDVIVINDYVPDWVMRNDGEGSFAEVATAAGFNAGNFKGCGMGVDATDLNADGWFDFIVTDYNSNSALLISNGDGTWTDENSAWGIETTPTVGWGVIFGDFDNDGWDDLFVATSDEQWQQWLYHNEAGTGFALEPVEIGRFGGQGIGAIAADYDQDGDLDVLEAHQAGVPTLLRNDSETSHWLRVAPLADDLNPSALGVRVMASVGERTWMREISGNTSQQSQTEPVAHFGLGDATSVDTLTVRWPSGDVDVEMDVATNQTIYFPRGGFPEPEPIPDAGGADEEEDTDAGGGGDAGEEADAGGDADAGADAGEMTPVNDTAGCGCALGLRPK